MISKIFSPELSTKAQLQQLVKLRLYYLLSEVVVVAASQYWFEFSLPWLNIWGVVAAHGLLTGGYYWLSKHRANIGENLLFQSIFVDILLFSALLYFAGGATNGAVTILLLPVATAAALFNWRKSLSLALLAIASYSLLMIYSWQGSTTSHAHHQSDGFSTHILAMWLTFIFSCLLLVWFIGMQSYAAREKHRKLSQLRESQLRDEQLIAIATFAANAAHDLATPLSSIGLLCDELKHDEGKEGVDTLIQQVKLCQSIVQSISHQAILNKAKICQQENVQDYFTRLLQRWLVTRPEIIVTQLTHQDLPAKQFEPDASLQSAITNILDNAADASAENGRNQLNWSLSLFTPDIVEIKIEDFGTGIGEALLDVLGNEPVNSTKEGLGLGQFLANATIGRCGGNLWRQSHSTGTVTVIQLPIKSRQT